MASKFDKLMQNYGKVKKLPIDSHLMSLSPEESKLLTPQETRWPTIVSPEMDRPNYDAPSIEEFLASRSKGNDQLKLEYKLGNLSEIKADFHGWVCFHDRYNPVNMGLDLVVEVLEQHLGIISADRSHEITSNGVLNEEEKKAVKQYTWDEVASGGGEETSYWVGLHPNANGSLYLALYQYEDGSRELAGIFQTLTEALKYGEEAGFDLVGA